MNIFKILRDPQTKVILQVWNDVIYDTQPGNGVAIKKSFPAGQRAEWTFVFIWFKKAKINIFFCFAFGIAYLIQAWVGSF